MLSILGFNESPRPNWNTAQLVKSTLAGAAAQGANTEYFDLQTLNIKPCQSCLICKKVRTLKGNATSQMI
jgi:multimeric flavodoxin WrbA